MKRAAHDTSPTNPVTAYAHGVLAGEILAGRAVRQACARQLRDVDDGPARGLRFDRAAMMRALTFFSALRLPESGEPFVLLPWQVFVIGSWAGWLKQTAAGWIRRIRTIYCEAGKGSGKSPLAGGFGLYGLVADGEPGAQVLLGATKREQAGIVFDDARKMVEASPMLSRIVQQSVTTLSVATTGSVLRAVSSEARTLDGWRGHFIVVDELHEHPSDLVLVKLSASTKGRLQPCILTITNAGVERASACWQQHQYALQVLEGTIEDDTLFAYVSQLDACADCLADGHVAPVDGCTQCDNWKNEALWPKTNPSLPITPTVEYLRAQVREAVGMPAREALVRRLNFCEWLEAHSRWLDMDAWHGCIGDVTAADLLGRPCYAGLDLGQSDDFSAFVRLWVLEDGRVVVRARFWLPESALKAYPTRPYDVWRRAGHLSVTEGTTTDYDRVEAEIVVLARESGVSEIGYDKRFAQQMALHLEGAGLTLIDTPQGFHLNEALRRVHDLVKERRLIHRGDPILAWMASNAIVRTGARGEIRLDKEKSGDKVDGIAALAMAVSRVIIHAPQRSVYEDRGVLAL